MYFKTTVFHLHYSIYIAKYRVIAPFIDLRGHLALDTVHPTRTKGVVALMILPEGLETDLAIILRGAIVSDDKDMIAPVLFP